MDEIKIPDEEHNHWLQHPTTQAERHNLSVLVDKALSAVLGAARESSDPNVRGKFAKYETYLKMLKLFQERHETSEQDGTERG